MVRVDLITGFLGAGKTTFIKAYVNYLQKRGEKVAIIENEFGLAGVDTAILKQNQLVVKQLVGGCICCSQKVNFHDLMLSLSTDYDCIIVEPSGIFSINDFFDILKSPSVQTSCRIGNIITIVDPTNLNFSSKEVDQMIANQILCSGQIVLSKASLISTQQLEASLTYLNNICRAADTYKQLPIIYKVWDEFTEEDFHRINHCGYNDICMERLDINHQMLFNSTTIYISKMSESAVNHALTYLMNGDCGNILRIKGHILVSKNTYLQINCTATEYSIEHCHGEFESALNIIGMKLNRKYIKTLLNEALLTH